MNYQDQPRFGEFGHEQPEPHAQPERLSIMALLSMITGVLALPVCCLPFVGTAFGILPAALGVGGILATRSRKARGRGLAIAGLIMGVIALTASSLFWGVVGGQITKMPAVYAQVLDADTNTARSVLTPGAAAAVSDEELAAFRAAFVASYGDQWSPPDGLLKFITSFGKITDPSVFETATAAANGSQSAFPLVLETDSGHAVLVVLMDQSQQLGSGLPAIGNALFKASNGTDVWLHDPNGTTPPVNPDQSRTPEQADTPEAADTDDTPPADQGG